MQDKILVVDTDQLIRYGLEKALRERGIATSAAATAEEALEHLAVQPYNLCLLDVDLPDLNCLDLIKIIHASYPRTWIMLMATDQPADLSCLVNRDEAKSFGVCHLVTKPFDLKELIDTIMKVLKKEREYFTDVIFTGETLGVGQRKNHRKLHIQPFTFFLNHIAEGEAKRTAFSAVSTDIGHNGIGLLTQCPIRKTEVLSFDERFHHRSGVVVWSHMVDDQTCRAGIRFA